jgi:hypothetical protein
MVRQPVEIARIIILKYFCFRFHALLASYLRSLGRIICKNGKLITATANRKMYQSKRAAQTLGILTPEGSTPHDVESRLVTLAPDRPVHQVAVFFQPFAFR